MMVRARDDIYRMTDLKGKKIGISKSLNTIKNDWWRIQEEQGIELMLRVNGMTRDDVKIVDFPYPDDWYDDPKMMGPIDNASELWLKRDHKHDLAFRPLEMALLERARSMRCTPRAKFSSISRRKQASSRQSRTCPSIRTGRCKSATCPPPPPAPMEMAEKHPELVVTWLKAMIKVGRWANEHKHAAASILDKQTYYRDVEDTYRGIKDVDMVPNLSPKNLGAVEIGKDFMLSHGYIKNDFDVNKWAAPRFLEKAAEELVEEKWKKVTKEKLPEASELLATTQRIG